LWLKLLLPELLFIMSDSLPALSRHPIDSLRHNPAAMIVLTLAALLLLALAWPMYAELNGKANQMQAISNCKEVILMMRVYAADNSGVYPDAPPKAAANTRTANEAFRELFKGGVCEDEMIFGCPDSPFKPDGKIGAPPDYLEAVKKGENHWAITAGLNDSASSAYPLVFENPLDARLPPRWDTNAPGEARPGRCWLDARIVLGFNDGSVELLPLEADPGSDAGLLKPFDGSRKGLTGQPIFFGVDPENRAKLHLLQVEQ
jgi:hypothetical protein